MKALPPVAKVALLFGAGIAVRDVGGWAPTLLALSSVGLLALIRPSARPLRRGTYLLVFVAGCLHAGRGPELCGTGVPARLVGYLEAEPQDGSAPFRIAEEGCRVTAVFAPDATAPAGIPVSVQGRWRQGRRSAWFQVASWEPASAAGFAFGRAAARWRGEMTRRLERRYGDRVGIASALILARREGLDRTLRDDFARAGVAHLLAISGFHVGVVAALLTALLRSLRLPRRSAAVLSAGMLWVYVAVIGFPGAAVRAALILSLLSAASARGRPTARWGPLGAALLVLLVWDPNNLREAGFQLSFAGAAGLMAWSRPVEYWIGRWLVWPAARPLVQAVSVGVAATAATAPIVAWHFEEVSLVGVPVTLWAGPLVGLAVPGALVSLALEPVLPPLAGFLAGGVDAILIALRASVRAAADPGWASAWIPRSWLLPPALGVMLAAWLVHGRGFRGRTRRTLLVLWSAIVVVAWPLAGSALRTGTVEIVTFDVGQGDAIGVRTPGGRWVVIDTGAEPRSTPARMERLLRARGVRSVATLVLTHPDADHIGEAAELIRSMPVGVVVDPGRPTAKDGYRAVLEAADERGVPWRAVEAGDAWALDGVEFRVLAPLSGVESSDTESNASSVVLHVRFGDFDALLMGDAPAAVENVLADDFDGGVEWLKVGHHGSRTSTSQRFLDRTRPEHAVLSLGRNNRYGHPDQAVVARLQAAGAVIHRTDRRGTLSVLAREDGSLRIRSER